ncbi:hypothetical protein Tco_1270935 [Tanacetum coccineum]
MELPRVLRGEEEFPQGTDHWSHLRNTIFESFIDYDELSLHCCKAGFRMIIQNKEKALEAVSSHCKFKRILLQLR